MGKNPGDWLRQQIVDLVSDIHNSKHKVELVSTVFIKSMIIGVVHAIVLTEAFPRIQAQNIVTVKQ